MSATILELYTVLNDIQSSENDWSRWKFLLPLADSVKKSFCGASWALDIPSRVREAEARRAKLPEEKFDFPEIWQKLLETGRFQAYDYEVPLQQSLV